MKYSKSNLTSIIFGYCWGLLQKQPFQTNDWYLNISTSPVFVKMLLHKYEWRRMHFLRNFLLFTGLQLMLLIQHILRHISRHTYECNCWFQLFSQDYDLASHTAQVVCVKFINEKWYPKFKVDFERQILEKLYSGWFFCS